MATDNVLRSLESHVPDDAQDDFDDVDPVVLQNPGEIKFDELTQERRQQLERQLLAELRGNVQ